MTVIPPSESDTIRTLFTEHLTGPVKVAFFTRRPSPVIVPGREECQFCPQIGAMLEHLVTLSPKLSLTTHEFVPTLPEAQRYAVTNVPTMVLRGTLNRPVRYQGMPSGYQFAAFIDLCVLLSRGKSMLTAAGRRRLQRVQRDISVEVFVTPESSDGPETARAAVQLSLASARIHVTITEISEFPTRAHNLDIREVPLTVIDDTICIAGPLEGDALLDAVVRTAEKPRPTSRRTSSALILGPTDTGPIPGETRPSGLIIPR